MPAAFAHQITDTLSSCTTTIAPSRTPTAVIALLDDSANYERDVLGIAPPFSEELLHQQSLADAAAASVEPGVAYRVPSLSSSAASRSSLSLESPTADMLTAVPEMPSARSLSVKELPTNLALPESPPRSLSVSIPQYDSLGRIIRHKRHQNKPKSSGSSDSADSLECKSKRKGLLSRLRKEPKLPSLDTIVAPTTPSQEQLTYPTSPTPSLPAREAAHTPFETVALAHVHRQSPDMLKEAAKDPAFREMQTCADEEHQRFVTYEKRLHETLTKHFNEARATLKSQHSEQTAALKSQHAHALEELEERQVIMEHELRNAQVEERQNVLTALKHMEGYCSETSNRTVTDEDRSKLQAQRAKRDLLDAKHASAINVLRQKQERTVKTRRQKQLQELSDLDQSFIERMTALHEQEEQTRSKLAEVMTLRRSRLIERWDLKLLVWQKQREAAQSGIIPTPAATPSPLPSPTLSPLSASAPSVSFAKQLFREIEWSNSRAEVLTPATERPYAAVA